MTFKKVYECFIKQNYIVILDLKAKKDLLEKLSK